MHCLNEDIIQHRLLVLRPESGKTMCKILSWIAECLEHQHVKLETLVQAPVQDTIVTSQQLDIVWELNILQKMFQCFTSNLMHLQHFEICILKLIKILISGELRPGADQSSKAAFGKSAFAKTCFLLLKKRLAHSNRAKSKNAFEHVLAQFSRKHFACCTYAGRRPI